MSHIWFHEIFYKCEWFFSMSQARWSFMRNKSISRKNYSNNGFLPFLSYYPNKNSVKSTISTLLSYFSQNISKIVEWTNFSHISLVSRKKLKFNCWIQNRKRSCRVLYLLPQSKSSLLYSLIIIIAILKWRREGVPRPIKLNSVPSKCETPCYKNLDALPIHFRITHLIPICNKESEPLS